MAENETPPPLPLKILSSPHIRTRESVPRIMWTVNAVLAPVGLYAVFFFGWRALLTIALCVGAAVLTEFLVQRLRKMAPSHWDGSAVLTGLLFAYVMPANQPWYVSVFGSAFAIGIAKHAFGGLGNNIWNPALVARAFVLAAWPAVTILGASWPLPGPDATPVLYDLDDYRYAEAPVTVTAPSPLSDTEVERAEDWREAVDRNVMVATGMDPDDPEARMETAYLRMLLGWRNGCLGEAMGALLILGGVVLIILGHVNWRVPVFFIASALVVAFVLPEKIRLAGGGSAWTGWFASDPGNLLRHLLGGGLLIGAFFMATDMVTSPVTNRGAIIFAVGCGVITALIRLLGGYPEGVSYSIILMNTAVPLIDRHTRPRTYGEVQG